MALKAVLTKAEHDALPDALKEHYTEKDGAFALDAEGLVPSGRLDEFRDNNRKMKTELETARAKLQAYDGVDPAELKHLRDEVARLSKAPAKTGDELAEAIAKATKPIKDDLDQIKRERDELKVKNEEQAFTTTVTAAAQKLGVQADFVGDILARTRAKGFKLTEDGDVRGFKGEEILRGDDGKELTLEKFIRDQPQAFFGVTKGSGTSPNVRPGSGGNGAAKILYDPTPLEMGRNADKIAKGEIEVRRTT